MAHFEALLAYSPVIDPWNSYFETNDQAESELDLVTANEFNHYISIVGGSELRNKANYDEKKEPQVRSLLLEFLGTLRSVPGNSWGLLVYQFTTFTLPNPM